MKIIPHLFLALSVLCMTALTASACGVNSHCKIGDRFYYIDTPNASKPTGAIVFLHGLQGTALGTIRNKGLRKLASDLGVALVAVKSKGASWSLPNSPLITAGANELKYMDKMRRDIIKRHNVDPDRIVIVGASMGGMMTWHMACYRSADYAGFVPMSGTFWTPMPTSCKGPVANVVHMHGTKDKTVPLTGRQIRNSHQGDVAKAVNMYANYGGFNAPKTTRPDGLICKIRKNAQGNILNFCLYDGGHSFRRSNIREAWKMLTRAGAL